MKAGPVPDDTANAHLAQSIAYRRAARRAVRCEHSATAASAGARRARWWEHRAGFALLHALAQGALELEPPELLLLHLELPQPLVADDRVLRRHAVVAVVDRRDAQALIGAHRGPPGRFGRGGVENWPRTSSSASPCCSCCSAAANTCSRSRARSAARKRLPVALVRVVGADLVHLGLELGVVGLHALNVAELSGNRGGLPLHRRIWQVDQISRKVTRMQGR